MKAFITLVLSVFLSTSLYANEYLVRFNTPDTKAHQAFFIKNGGKAELVSAEGLLYKWTSTIRTIDSIIDSTVSHITLNRPLGLIESPSLTENRPALLNQIRMNNLVIDGPAYPDNPEVQSPALQGSGMDPLFESAWGMVSVDAATAYQKTPQGKQIIVAVTDSGVDYNHPDLIRNMWNNKNEIAGNGLDDDGNGYVDDLVGWDFYSNDNKPYDLSMDLMDILLKGGNPGHGTHVAGVVGATLNNAQGTAGIAPQVKIMALRFIGETGKGSTEGAIKAIDYAVKNGAKIINASWGGEADPEENDKPLQEAIHRAEEAGVLFIAAAGNGRLNQTSMKAEGFDSDNDPKPILPASYNYPNMIAVSALDSSNNLAPFSNWGFKSTKLGAPGVKILSTVPGNRYQDTVVNLGSIKATWDGTSMAAPFVAGAAAAIWSIDPAQTASSVKEKLLSLTMPAEALKNKVSTEGRLSLSGLH